jgi:hypothetical protein
MTTQLQALLKIPTAKEQEFINCASKIQLYGGAKRGGKSVAGCMKAVLLSVLFPGNRGIIARQSGTDLRDSTLVTFLQICAPEVILDHRRGDRTFLIRTSGKPSEILYRGLGEEGEEEKIKGMDMGWYWIDEPSECPKNTWMMLHSQLNWVLPSGERPPYMGMLTSNPEPGWVKDLKEAIDKKTRTDATFIRALPRDNPHLPPGWEQELRNDFPDEWVRKYLDGSWDVAEGQVFPELSEEHHNLDNWTDRWDARAYLDWLASLRLHASVDHATTGTTAMVETGQDRSDNIYALEEYYQQNRLVSEHAAKMAGILTGNGKHDSLLIDPSTEAKTQVGKLELYSILDEYRRQGEPFKSLLKPAPRSEIRIGINLLKERLKVNPMRVHPFTGSRGSPSLFISKKRNPCGWREMIELRQKVKDNGDIEYIGSDHWVDCLHGDTEIATVSGPVKIRNLVGTTGKVLGPSGWNQYSDCKLYRKQSRVVRVGFDDGTELLCTPDHLLLAIDGAWIPAESSCNHLVGAESMPKQGRVLTVGAASEFLPNIPSSVIVASPVHGVRVTSVTPAGYADTYCLNAEPDHSFALANGVIVHNCLRYICMSRPNPKPPEKQVIHEPEYIYSGHGGESEGSWMI